MPIMCHPSFLHYSPHSSRHPTTFSNTPAKIRGFTLSRPVSELTWGDIKALVKKNLPPTSSKRPLDCTNIDSNQNVPGTSKRARGGAYEADPSPVVLPATIGATILAGHPPSCLRILELSDNADLESRVFCLCRQPQSATLIRCLLCWILFGCWKTWGNNDGLITRICEHLDKNHPTKYHDKCHQEGVIVPTLNSVLTDNNTSDLVFLPQLLAEYLAQWAAIDDQTHSHLRHTNETT
ncbi:hypothetical protein B0J17DRAFT_630001 [Rhizoctonia solani]|nr:hypothetical protein B0J17DRAFT_630001 [Rhizoctonia solani]